MNKTGKEYISTADSIQAEGWVLEPDPEVMPRLKGCLSNHQQKQQDGVLCYLYGIRGSGRTRTGAVAALVQAIENPGTPKSIFNHSGTDSYAMAIVGDHIRMILERFPENMRGRFKIDKSKPMADTGLPFHLKIAKPVIQINNSTHRKNTPLEIPKSYKHEFGLLSRRKSSLSEASNLSGVVARNLSGL